MPRKTSKRSNDPEFHRKNLREYLAQQKKENYEAGVNLEMFIEKLLTLFSDTPPITWRFRLTTYKNPVFRIYNQSTRRSGDFLLITNRGLTIMHKYFDKRFRNLFPKKKTFYGNGDTARIDYSVFDQVTRKKYYDAIKSMVTTNKDWGINFPGVMVDSLSEQDSKPYNDLPTTYDNGAKDDSDFYQILRSKIRKWAASKKGKNNKWVEFILLAPDLFHLLCKLVIDDDVSLEDKVKLALVIVYFVSPLDLIPEGILGPMAYVDDIALSVYVLNRILNNTSPEVLRRHWVGEEDILTVIKQILKVADQMVGSGLWSKLKGMIR